MKYSLKQLSYICFYILVFILFTPSMLAQEPIWKQQFTPDASLLFSESGFVLQTEQNHESKLLGDSVKPLMDRANAYVSRTDLPKAYDIYSQIYQYAKQENDTFYLLKSINNIAVLNRYGSYHQNAALLFYQKLEILQNGGEKYEEQIVKTLMNIAAEYYDLGMLQVAITYHQKVAEYEDQYPQYAIHGINGWGLCEELLGNYSQAMRIYERALQLCDRVGYRDERLRVMNNIGILLSEQKQYEKALEVYNDARAFYPEVRDRFYFELEVNRMNMIYELKRYDEAETVSKRLIGEFQGIDMPYLLSLAVAIQGHVLHEKGFYHEAIRYYEEQIRLLELTNSQFRAPMVYINIGNSYKELKAYDKALALMHKGLRLQEKYQRKREQLTTMEFIVDVYERKQETDSALFMLKEVVALKDSLFESETASEVFAIQEKYESEKKDAQILLLKKDQHLQQLKLERQNNQVKWGLVIILLIVIVGYLVYKNYQSRIAKNQAILLKDKLQLEQRLFRVQMNPHFIFNSLNSIQGYVSESDSWNAEVYLSKFASLMRTTLEHSQKEWVLLSDDIKNLRLYVELERLRFNKQFDYSCEVDISIEDDAMVPPMLLQPFVENAILHGLAARKEGGKLKVTLHLEEDCIKAIITDNGIGRKEAALIKRKGKHHKSMGVSLTSQRIAILIPAISQAVTYKDLDEGTEVFIILPLKYLGE